MSTSLSDFAALRDTPKRLIPDNHNNLCDNNYNFFSALICEPLASKKL